MATLQMFSIDQAASALAVHPQTVRRMIRRGDLAAAKVGRHWRVPERALSELASIVPAEPQTDATQAQAEAIWAQMTSEQAGAHNAALRVLFQAPDDVQRIVMARSAEAAARYYATPEGEAELADWRALDGEPFHDESGDYYTDEEEAEFRAQRTAKGDAE